LGSYKLKGAHNMGFTTVPVPSSKVTIIWVNIPSVTDCITEIFNSVRKVSDLLGRRHYCIKNAVCCD
jgi:hypothetical protein